MSTWRRHVSQIIDDIDPRGRYSVTEIINTRPGKDWTISKRTLYNWVDKKWLFIYNGFIKGDVLLAAVKMAVRLDKRGGPRMNVTPTI